jgi:hypothetical protein
MSEDISKYLQQVFVDVPIIGRVLYSQFVALNRPKSSLIGRIQLIYMESITWLLTNQKHDDAMSLLQYLRPSTLTDDGKTTQLSKLVNKLLELLDIKDKERAGKSLIQYTPERLLNGISKPNLYSVFLGAMKLHFQPSYIARKESTFDKEEIHDPVLLKYFVSKMEMRMHSDNNNQLSDYANLLMPLQVSQENITSQQVLNGYWSRFFNHVRIHKIHFLEYAMDLGIAGLSQEHSMFEHLSNYLATLFEKLKPLLLLMAWDRFGDTVISNISSLSISFKATYSFKIRRLIHSSLRIARIH